MISLTAPVTGIVDGIASFVQAVSAVGEAAIKGVGNLLNGAMACDVKRLKRGALQLILGTSVIGVF